ncbi:hypothetical protein CEXT_747481 [Caerostris extrusa]|uniref:Uncharacterized protein n=1 Tax=Caerostris extrusa TaxID=172846 RepID=A0AAV4T3E7_CAEEX|nr:hypothetical protein CEXT_747481 [Caerostris extrusa]
MVEIRTTIPARLPTNQWSCRRQQQGHGGVSQAVRPQRRRLHPGGDADRHLPDAGAARPPLPAPPPHPHHHAGRGLLPRGAIHHRLPHPGGERETALRHPQGTGSRIPAPDPPCPGARRAAPEDPDDHLRALRHATPSLRQSHRVAIRVLTHAR